MTDEYVTTYLTVEDLIDLTEAHGTTVADLGLLSSAAARPGSSVAGQDAYPPLQEKAAALADSLCSNHPMVDGNERLTLGAVVVFLSINGFRLDLDQEGKFDLIMAMARGDLRSVPAIAARLPLVPFLTR